MRRSAVPLQCNAMKRELPFSIRFTSELKSALQKLADEDRRTLTSYIELVLSDHVAERQKREAKRK